MSYYSRKRTRLKNYDYSNENYYFITICTHNKKCIFGKPGELNELGIIAEKCILSIQGCFPNTRVDNYIVMPNHIHMILVLERQDSNSTIPDLSNVIGQYKMTVTKKVRTEIPNMKVWQRSYHDHIIRNQQAYEKIWNYVEYNDQKWSEDCFYHDDF